MHFKFNYITISSILISLGFLIGLSCRFSTDVKLITLSSIRADLNGDGVKERIFKKQIINHNSKKQRFFIEIEGIRKRNIRIFLRGISDAFFFLDNNRSNIFAVDLNEDGVEDIMTAMVNRKRDVNIIIFTLKNNKVRTLFR